MAFAIGARRGVKKMTIFVRRRSETPVERSRYLEQSLGKLTAAIPRLTHFDKSLVDITAHFGNMAGSSVLADDDRRSTMGLHRSTCVPFLVPEYPNQQGDVSAITSPCFEATTPSFPNNAGRSASLFARLSRGSNEHEKLRLLSPATPKSNQFDSLSTIGAEVSLFDRIEDEGSRNGEEDPASAKDVVADKTPSRASPIPIQTSAQAVKATTHGERRHDQSVSWEIASPSTEHEHQAKPSEAALRSKTSASSEGQNDLCHRLEASTISAANTFSSKGESNSSDEWREVTDPESGRIYYYNRRTRVSKWKLPRGAILVKKLSNRSHNQSHYTHQESQIKMLQSPTTQSSSQDVEQSTTGQQHQRKEECQRILQVTQSSSEETFHLKHIPDDMHLNVHDTASVDPDPSHLKSPQDCSTTNGLFCVYCGLKCSVAKLEAHLSQCLQFTQIQQADLPTQIELESILFRAWSQIGSSAKISANPSYDKEAKLTTTYAWDSQTLSLGRSYDAFSEDDRTEACPIQTPTPRRQASNVIYSVEKKSCPFCGEVSSKGNEFSSHLLNCHQRKLARKQRRTKKKDNMTDDPQRRCMTPGRRMPWE